MLLWAWSVLQSFKRDSWVLYGICCLVFRKYQRRLVTQEQSACFLDTIIERTGKKNMITTIRTNWLDFDYLDPIARCCQHFRCQVVTKYACSLPMISSVQSRVWMILFQSHIWSPKDFLGNPWVTTLKIESRLYFLYLYFDFDQTCKKIVIEQGKEVTRFWLL